VLIPNLGTSWKCRVASFTPRSLFFRHPLNRMHGELQGRSGHSGGKKTLPLLSVKLRILGSPRLKSNISPSISSSSSYGSRYAFPLFSILLFLCLAAARQVFALSDAALSLRTSYSYLFLGSSAELHFPRLPSRVRFVFLL
jgi:hypothetical protein